ncbi:MAG: hypothetical protein ACTSU6_04030 [Candidatus Njordarchaeales archaeon]
MININTSPSGLSFEISGIHKVKHNIRLNMFDTLKALGLGLKEHYLIELNNIVYSHFAGARVGDVNEHDMRRIILRAMGDEEE